MKSLKGQKILYFIYLCIIFSCKENIIHIEKTNLKENDSISFFINQGKNKLLSVEERKANLKKSYNKIISAKIDSNRTRQLSVISYQFLKLKDTSSFKRINKVTIIESKKINDYFSLGDAHWNYATFYNNRESFSNAYYHFNLANSFFEKSKYVNEAAITQYGMAFIRGRYRDYSGSETLLFKAIKKFEKTNNHRYLYNCYNYLAILQNDIDLYDKALFYHEKSLQFLKKINKPNFYNISYNNIGTTYIKKGEPKKAINYFNRVLSNDKLKKTDIETYARIISNKAYSQLLLNDTTFVLKKLNESLKIRDSLKNKTAIVNSKIYLSKYYSFIKKNIKALKYAREANLISKSINNGRDYLETLLLLARFDKENSSKHLSKYISFSDSLQKSERKIGNKFIRIEYETDEYIKKNKLLSQQNFWILIVSLTLILIIILIFKIYRQKSKNKELFLENEKQKSNEQLYRITLNQQVKLEKEKFKERIRISEELHDGILGKLFGTRLGMGFLNVSSDENIKKKFQNYLEELHLIEKEIREVSHQLNNNLNSKVNFESVLKELIKSNVELIGLKAKLQISKEIVWGAIDENIKVNLYRIFQEAIQNIIKYSFAKNIDMQISLDEEILHIMIKDNGKGFDVRMQKKGIGIKNIKSRIARLCGEFLLTSNLDLGTKIDIKIPIKKHCNVKKNFSTLS